MTLEQLRIFVAVAERQHLTQAALALHLSPSAVSAAIKTLEQRYGAVLFDRAGRGITTTALGEAFLPEARAALAAASAAERALTESGMVGGRLALRASQTVGAYWLPEGLMRFHLAFPAVELSLQLGNTETVAAAVLSGEADLGFIEGDIDKPALASRQIAEDRLVIVTAPGHPWTIETPGVAELAAGRWLLREQGSGTRSAFERALSVLGIAATALDVAMTLPSNEAILTALQGGSVAAAISERAVAAFVAAGQLTTIDVPLAGRIFSMLGHKARYQTRAARLLQEMLTSSNADGQPNTGR